MTEPRSGRRSRPAASSRCRTQACIRCDPCREPRFSRLGWQKRPDRPARGVRWRQYSSRACSAWTPGVLKAYYPRGALNAQQYLYEGGSTELEQRTAAHNDARAQALARLREAARATGALAVVDVRIRRGRFRHAAHAIEFTAFGTASRLGRSSASTKTSRSRSSAVSGGDFWKLLASGYWPLGLVGGTSVPTSSRAIARRCARFRLSRRSLQNQEYEDYTNGLLQARVRAVGRLRREARELGAQACSASRSASSNRRKGTTICS